MSKEFKTSLISVIALVVFSVISMIGSGMFNIKDCNKAWKFKDSEIKVRDYAVENPLSYGFLNAFKVMAMSGDEFPNGGVEADARDAFAVGKKAYCLNVKHSSSIYKTGLFFGFLSFFCILFFVWGRARSILYNRSRRN